MQESSSSLPVRDLVLIGGGHAHVHVLKMLGMAPIPHLRVILISRDIESPYSGMIPGYLAGYYSHEECHIDICKLAGFAQARFIHGEVIHIDTAKREVFFADALRPPIHYHLLSIDIGIIPKPLPRLISEQIDFEKKDLCITPVKPIDRFSWKWKEILQKFSNVFETNRKRQKFRLIIVGGGGGGTELSFAVNYRLKSYLNSLNLPPNLVEVTLLNKSKRIMDKHAKLVSSLVERLLTEKEIQFFCEANIVDVKFDPQSGFRELLSQDGRCFPYDEAIWCTEAMGQSWLKNSGLALDGDNCILVQPTLESVNTPGVFAAGDICSNVKYPRPKAGVFAVRAGPPLLSNLKHSLFGESLEEWVPQDEFLGLIGTGDYHAIATKGGLALEGSHLWTLKDKIDRQWMRGYQQLPSMEEMQQRRRKAAEVSPEAGARREEIKPEIAGLQEPEIIQLLQKSKMRCAGCGSKVGASVISRAFTRLQLVQKESRETIATYRPEVLAGIGDDAAITKIIDPSKLLVQTIDYFRSFVADPYLFGQIAANHALSDVFAMNGEAVTALALCILPFGPEQMVEDDLVQMLAGMKSVLVKERCALVGGHTSEGSESALGLAVTGMVDPLKVFHKGPILRYTGYHLVLTKPIGTGTILAAQMRNQAKGRWLEGCYQMMLQSNSTAASVLASFQCVACTDVTGFGLLGHLIEMIKYEEVSTEIGRNFVRLDLSRIPVLAGAIACSQEGVVSSLFPQNVRSQQFIRNVYESENHPIYRLLFDPQTSGGLLAVVPPDLSTAAILQLSKQGYTQAAVIGEVVTCDPVDNFIEEDFCIELNNSMC